MKLWDIVKKVGSGLISTMVPGGGLLIDAVNAVLPDDKKLPADATGEQMKNAVESLPPEQRAAVMEKEFDVEITEIKESHSTIRTMLESDAKNPHSTRPYIAKHSFHVIGIVTLVVTLLWAYGVYVKDDALVKTIMEGWQFILAVNAPLVVLLRSYFGVLKVEHKNKLDAANGASNPTGIAGILSMLKK